MAGKRNRRKKEEIIDAEVISIQEHSEDISNLSIPELAQQIENKIVDPKIIDKIALEKVAVYFRMRRGYKTGDIAEILQVCGRTIERYIKDVKSDTALKIGANFQNELLGEILSDFRLHYQRLWRLSYSESLSDYEKARTIFMCSQIRVNEVAILGRLGYLSIKQGLEAIENVKEEIRELERKSRQMVDKKLSVLTSWQFQSILEVCRGNSSELETVLEKMVNDYEAENERQMKLVGYVADFSRLYCSVFVINELRN